MNSFSYSFMCDCFLVKSCLDVVLPLRHWCVCGSLFRVKSFCLGAVLPLRHWCVCGSLFSREIRFCLVSFCNAASSFMCFCISCACGSLFRVKSFVCSCISRVCLWFIVSCHLCVICVSSCVCVCVCVSCLWLWL